MDNLDSPNPMTVSANFLSTSSQKKRAAAETLQDCLRHGGFPKLLRPRMERAIETLSKNLRLAYQNHEPEAATPEQRAQRRADKEEALEVLKELVEASIPNWFKPRVRQAIRDLTGNLEHSPGGASYLAGAEETAADAGTARRAPKP